MAAASSDTPWAKIDPTLWNMAFAGHAKAQRCKFCFSLTHALVECDWAPTAAATEGPPQSSELHSAPGIPKSKFAIHGTTLQIQLVHTPIAVITISVYTVPKTLKQWIETTKRSIAARGAPSKGHGLTTPPQHATNSCYIGNRYQPY